MNVEEARCQLNMAEFGSKASLEQMEKEEKSSLPYPLKLRQILSEVLTSEDSLIDRSSQVSNLMASNLTSDTPCEATNQEAFFHRVESYSCLKWTGKPYVLSPLRCAQYGWINVDCDMLMCCSCQMFLCASVQPAQDFEKYQRWILELTRQLKTQHKEFCSWPDFPCPERFCMIPFSEPDELLGSFLERFKSIFLLQHQLPALNAEQFKAMALTKDVRSSLLQLITSVKMITEDSSFETENIQMVACTLALCGWTASPDLNLPVLTCGYCVRKIGMWNFHQLESASVEWENSSYLQSPISIHETRTGDRMTDIRMTHTSPTQSLASCRMKLRSQDPTRIEQLESTISPLTVRTRSRDSFTLNEEVLRGKRPLTRSRGHGDSLIAETSISPQRKTKRPRLSSAGSLEGYRNLFDPVGQHRHWCPWVNVVRQDEILDDSMSSSSESHLPLPGWKAALRLLLFMKSNHNSLVSSPSQGTEDKSRRIFSIFCQ